jgi:hypothetical protein
MTRHAMRQRPGMAWLATCAALLPLLLASAAARDDYLRQWPLDLHGSDAGAYRAVLDRAVYTTARSPSLRDVDVVNADGRAVPAAVFDAAQPLAQAPRRVALPWFALPGGPAAQAADITVISQRADDGSVLQVRSHVGGVRTTAPSPARAWLVDASQLHEPIAALQLTWSSATAPLDTAYRVEGSDDLRQWRTLQPSAPLLDLQRDGQHLRQRRIPLEGSARYLRLLPTGASPAPVLTGVQAELQPQASALPWTWETLRGSRQDDRATAWIVFELDGRFPVERADVVLPGNNAGQWTLQSRDDAHAPWQTRAGPWVAYSVGQADGDRSAPQVLGATVRDRHWRLSSTTPTDGLPELRLGYRPEVLVFVAQGRAPFALVAGSARAVRADAPLAVLVDALRRRHGDDWQPADASLGAPSLLAGNAALQPAPVQRDWKAWLLWSILVGGALLVAGFALSLLRKPTVD